MYIDIFMNDYAIISVVMAVKAIAPASIIIISFISCFALSCYIPIVFDCQNIQTNCEGADVIASYPTTIYNCSTTLILQAKQLDIQGYFTSLSLIGDNITISNLTILQNLNINVSQSLTTSDAVNVGGMLLVNSNSSADLVTSISNAIVTAEKIIMIGSDTVLINNSSILTNWNLCLYESISIIETMTIIQTMIDGSHTKGYSMLNFSIFITANKTIILIESDITTVSIGMIADVNITANMSNINTTAQSCKSNTGQGRGAIIQYNNANCTSGGSSCGYGLMSNSTLCEDMVQYFLFLSHSFPYISKGPYLYTGSGGYGINIQKDGKGAGGGIVYIYSKDAVRIASSIIQASGGNVDPSGNLSAGSGGTIYITSKRLEGVGANNITASGGNSSNNKGAGGAGLVKMSYQTISQDPSYSLWVSISQGIQENSPNINIQSNGIFYGPLCQAGNQACYINCISCNGSTFSTLGDPICRPCPKSQQFNINQDIQSKSLISHCFTINKESDLLQIFSPGQIDVFYIGLYLVALVFFTIIGLILKKKIKKEKLLSGEEFKLQDAQKDIQKAKMLTLQLRKSKDIKPIELMYHVHRISCFGSNSETSPWVLPSFPPVEVRQYVLPQVYCNFAQNFNKSARWNRKQYWLTILASAIYPVYWYYLDKIKKKKYKKLHLLLQHAIDYNLINNYDYEDRSIVTIKFSKNKDYTNCYLDFFVYQRADLKYFTLSSPYILYLSGEGNFLRPFYLQEGDLFFRLMFFVVNREFFRSQEQLDEKKQLFSNMMSQKKKQKNNYSLNRFLRKLNTLACTLDLSSSNNDIIQILWNLVEFIQKWNQEFFNKVAVQLDLVIFMSRLMNKTVIDNQIQILTKKDKDQFKANILEKIEEISNWQESSIKIGLFVYNPEQQVPKQDQIQRSLLEQSQILLLSNQDQEETFRKSLLVSLNTKEKKRLHKKIIALIVKGIRLARHFMMSHKNTKYDEYSIKFLQSFFILLQAMLVFIWSIKVQIPYVFVNIAMPFIGIIWFISDSYGFGKLYLIFNTMTFINQIVTLVTYSSIETVILDRNKNTDMLAVKSIICTLINIIINIIMMFLGNRAITQSKKLSLKKEDINKPLKFE